MDASKCLSCHFKATIEHENKRPQGNPSEECYKKPLLLLKYEKEEAPKISFAWSVYNISLPAFVAKVFVCARYRKQDWRQYQGQRST